jgi:RHS repeat-associated protein
MNVIKILNRRPGKVAWACLIFFLFLTQSSHGQITLSSPNTVGNFVSVNITLSTGFTADGNNGVFSARADQSYAYPGSSNVANNFTSVWVPTLALTSPDVMKTYENDNSKLNIATNFVDGLGFTIQTIAKNQTVNNADFIQTFEYDNMGRELKKYLPYAYNSTNPGSYRPNANTSEQQAFYNSGNSLIAQNPYPTYQTAFDNSPLNRPLEQGQAGQSWQLTGSGLANSGHTSKFDYTDNNSTAISDVNNTRMVVYYGATIDASGNRSLVVNGTGYYASSDLYLTITKGANWVSSDMKAGTTETYSNKEGKVVLKRTFVNSGQNTTIISTYFVYDDFGNLCYVLPAGAAPDVLTTSNTLAINSTVLNNVCYQYTYDAKQRLIGKKPPGRDWEYLIYNRLNQQVAMQDGVQRTRNEWSVKKYDALGRPVINGIWTNGNTAISPAALQTILNGQSVLWETRTTTGNGYTTSAWPQTVDTYYSIDFFDDYNVPGLPVSFNYQTYAGNPAGKSNQTNGLATVSETWSLSNHATPLWTVQYYDIKDRPIQIQKTNQLQGVDISNLEYSFTGMVLKELRQHTTSSTSVSVAKRYIYDHHNRLLQEFEKIGNDPEVQLSELSYNDLGQVVNKKLHKKSGGSSFLQSVDYRYNIHGWLTSINDPSLTANATTNPDNSSVSDVDKFGVAYQYDQATIPEYNGNIGSMQWASASPSGQPASPLLKYDYRYDKINRMTEAVSSTTGTKNGSFAEYASYDVMGNLQTMGRWAKLAAGITRIDSLRYTYNGNQVNEIDDISGNNTYGFSENGSGSVVQGANEYAFDANGNQTKDQNKGITSIAYNNFYQPSTIRWSNGNTLLYDYDGKGNLLTSTFTAGGNTTTTNYISGIQYSQGQLNFIQTSEGNAVKNQSTGSFLYNYELKDRLGNTRVVVQPSGASENVALVVQVANFYPYGLEYKSDDSGLLISYLSGTKDNFLYNGKEAQPGTNYYNFGARQYDPAIGRWGVFDNLAEAPEQIGKSPYAYAWGNPVLNNDPDGNCPWCAVAGAVIGGAVNLATHWHGTTVWQKVAAFGIGAGAGAIAGLTLNPTVFTAAAGGSAAVLATLGNAAIGGAISGALSSVALGTANYAVFGDKYTFGTFVQGTLVGGAAGVVGRALGGVITGKWVDNGVIRAIDRPIAGPVTDGAMIPDNFVTPPELDEALTPTAPAVEAPSVAKLNLSGSYTYSTTQSLLERGDADLLVGNLAPASGKMIGTYKAYATAQLIDGTYNVNIFSVKNLGGKTFLGLNLLAKQLEGEAIRAGATEISIHGSTFYNTDLYEFLIKVAPRSGWTVEITSTGINFNKILTNINK